MNRRLAASRQSQRTRRTVSRGSAIANPPRPTPSPLGRLELKLCLHGRITRDGPGTKGDCRFAVRPGRSREADREIRGRIRRGSRFREQVN